LEYIRSHETEKLLEIYPYMQAVQNCLKQALSVGITKDDYIYSLAIGNRPMDGLPMPPVGNVSNPTCNIAISCSKAMQHDIQEINKDISDKILIISAAIERISCAFRRLPSLQQEVLKLHYWDKLTWKEISGKLSNEHRYISPNTAQLLRRKGIDKMTELMQFPKTEYSDLLNILHDIAK